MLKLLLFALATPMFGKTLFAQVATNLTASCPAPGTTATVQWQSSTTMNVVARIGKQGSPLWPPTPGFQQSPMYPEKPGANTTTFTDTIPGQAYWFYVSANDPPYAYNGPVTFTCAVIPPIPASQPSAGITVMLVGNAPPAGTPCSSPAVLETASGYCVATFAGVTTLRLNMGDMVVSALGFAGGTLAVQFDVAKAAQ